MNIALIANDSKKELMVQFCIAYCGILAKHNIISTRKTGRLIHEATGIEVESVLPGRQGGVQQISARINFNEIDAVIYFHDSNDIYDMNDNMLMRNCDFNNVPLATNLAAAEILVMAIHRGDLNWRLLLNPLYNKKKKHLIE